MWGRWGRWRCSMAMQDLFGNREKEMMRAGDRGGYAGEVGKTALHGDGNLFGNGGKEMMRARDRGGYAGEVGKMALQHCNAGPI